MRWLVAGILAVAVHAALLFARVSRRAPSEHPLPVEVVAEVAPEPPPPPPPPPALEPQRPTPPVARPRRPVAAPTPTPTPTPTPVEPQAGPLPGTGDGVPTEGPGPVALATGQGGFAHKLAGSFGAPPLPECPDSARGVFLVDRRGRLVRFDPAAAEPFALIGHLRCPASAAIDDWREDPHPYSMSVDRHGRAWVLYSSGEVFVVSTADASCRRAGWERGRGGYDLFGMGFALEGGRERLYIAGGSLAEMERGEGRLGTIDTTTLAAATVGRHRRGDHSPELGGAADALYAFYPGESVARIDPRTAEQVRVWHLPDLPMRGSPRTWAFAPWGGKFYLFVGEQAGGRRNRVYVLDPATGRGELAYDDIAYEVTGAGVSTCATP